MMKMIGSWYPASRAPGPRAPVSEYAGAVAASPIATAPMRETEPFLRPLGFTPDDVLVISLFSLMIGILRLRLVFLGGNALFQAL